MFNWKLVPHVTEHSVAVSQPAQPPTTKVYWLIYLFCWLAYVIKYNSVIIIDIANFRTWCLDVLYMPNEMIGFYSDEVLDCRIHVTLQLHITIPLKSSQSFIRRYNIPCLVKKQTLPILETIISCDKWPTKLVIIRKWRTLNITLRNHKTTPYEVRAH
jgi:hypothetical protein